MKRQELVFSIPQQDAIAMQRNNSALVGCIPSSWSSLLGSLKDPGLSLPNAQDVFASALHLSFEEGGEPRLTRRRKAVEGLEHADGLFRLINLHKRIGSIGFTYAGEGNVKATELLTICADLFMQGWIGQVEFSKPYFEREVRKEEALCRINFNPTEEPEISGSVYLCWGWDAENEEKMSPLRDFCKQNCRETPIHT